MNNIITIASPHHLYNKALANSLKKYYDINSIFFEKNLIKILYKFIPYTFYYSSRSKKIVHFHHFGLGRFSNFRTINIMINYLKFLGYKLVWTMHDVVNQEDPFKDLEVFKSFYNNIDYKVVHSPQSIDMIRTYYSINPDSNTILIPHISFNEFCINNMDSKECRRILNISDDDIVISFLGAIRMGKGIIEFLNVAKNMKDKQKVKFILAGKIIDKKHRNYINEHIASAKRLLGERLIMNISYIPENEMQIYFNSSDFLLIPHKNSYTTSGIIVLSYAYKKPVITSNAGGNPFYVVHNETGMLVNSEKIDELTDACMHLYNNPDLAKNMGERGYKYVDSIANCRLVAEKHYNLYKML